MAPSGSVDPEDRSWLVVLAAPVNARVTLGQEQESAVRVGRELALSNTTFEEIAKF